MLGQSDGDSEIAFPSGIEDLIPNGSELPPSIYMFDEDGQLRLIPRGTYRIHELGKQSSTLTVSRRFQFESIEIKGKASATYAELNFVLRIRSSENSISDLVSIPLELANFHRTEPLIVSGLESHQLTYDEVNKSYLLTGRVSNQDIVIRGTGMIRVNVNEASRSIDFRLPRAPVEIELTVDDGSAIGEVVADSEVGDIAHEPERVSSKRSVLRFSTAGGFFSTKWGSAPEEPSELQSLEVEGDWKINWEESTVDLTLNIRSLSGNISPFTLSVPGQYSLSNTVEITKIEQEAGLDSKFNKYLVTPLKEPRARINFQIDYPRLAYDSGNPFELEGILVEGSIQETGRVTIRTSRDNRLRWLAGAFVTPSTTALPAGDSLQNRVHEFRYSRGNFRLPVWVDAKSKQVRLRTNYDAIIDRNVIELKLLLDLAGTAVTGQSLAIGMEGWALAATEDLDELDAIGLEITDDTIKLEVDDLLSGLPYVQEDSRQLEIQLVRERGLQDDRVVMFPLPRITPANQDAINFVQIPGLARVSEASGAELIFDAKSSVGVAQSESTDEFQVVEPARRVELVHRVLAVESEVKTSVSLSLDTTQRPFRLTERIAFEFFNGSMSSLPVEISDPDKWRGESGDVPVSISGSSELGFSLAFAPLPPGRHELTLVREVAEPFEKIGLCIPSNSEIGPGANIPFTIFPDGNRLESGVGLSDGEGVVLGEDGTIQFAVAFSQVSEIDTLHVERLWMQTMIDPTQRRERILATVVGAADQLVMRCDHWNRVENSLAIVNGQQERNHEIVDGELRLPLEGEQVRTVVEIWVWTTREGPYDRLFERINSEIEVPHSVGEAYWQLVVPSQQHLVLADLLAGRAMNWEWDGFFLKRKDVFSTQQLESRFGASRIEQIGNANTYLFYSHLGNESVTVTLALRPTIWMLTGGIILILTSSLVYIPRLRRPLVLILFGSLILSLAAFAPDLAVIVGQVGVIALLFTAVLLLLRRALSTSRTSVFQSTPIPEGSTKSMPAPTIVPSTHTIDSLPVDSSVEAQL